MTTVEPYSGAVQAPAATQETSAFARFFYDNAGTITKMALAMGVFAVLAGLIAKRSGLPGKTVALTSTAAATVPVVMYGIHKAIKACRGPKKEKVERSQEAPTPQSQLTKIEAKPQPTEKADSKPSEPLREAQTIEKAKEAPTPQPEPLTGKTFQELHQQANPSSIPSNREDILAAYKKLDNDTLRNHKLKGPELPPRPVKTVKAKQ